MENALLEKYRKEYSELSVINKTISKYVSEREALRLEFANAELDFNKKLPKWSGSIGSDFSNYPTNTAVKRSMVIDGANIMHCGSVTKDTRYSNGNANNGRHIPDVLCLLSLLRYFFINDFDAFVVISAKYKVNGTTNFSEGIRELIKKKLCIVVSESTLDDVIALEFAASVNGAVVTSDQFRDHQSDARRYRHMVRMNRIGIEWRRPSRQYVRTSDSNHFVAGKVFSFVSKPNLRNIEEGIFSDVKDLRHCMAKERRELSWTDERKQEVIAFLNRLIIKGVEECPKNEKLILETPIHIPAYNFDAENESPGNDNENW